MLGSARATNEENYLAQKFARAVLGTNNVDCCARVCHAPSAAALKTMLGTGAATNSFDDIERARTILVCGTNTTENHPIVGARIKEPVLRGANLIVIDPRRIELAATLKSTRSSDRAPTSRCSTPWPTSSSKKTSSISASSRSACRSSTNFVSSSPRGRRKGRQRSAASTPISSATPRAFTRGKTRRCASTAWA